MEKKKDLKLIENFEGFNYNKYYDSWSVKDAIVNLKGETFVCKENPYNTDPMFDENAEKKNICISLDEDILSKHVLIMGGIGMGKTNTFLTFTKQLLRKCVEEDLFVIFDTKGDYFSRFGSHANENDILITNNPITDKNGVVKNSKTSNIWNIFMELNSYNTAEKDSKLAETSNEIAHMIFAEQIKKSSSPFFPMAACELFAGILRAMYRLERYFDRPLSNKLLKDFFDGVEVFKKNRFEKRSLLENIKWILEFGEERGLVSYLETSSNSSNDGNPQALGILAELRLVIDSLFIGNFAKEGDFSIKRAVCERRRDKSNLPSNTRIYIEYDIAEGHTLSPIYSLLFDLSIKESLETNRNQTNPPNSFFIVDEFRLLPHLQHLEDAVNFGRSLGIKFIIGIQNISQIIEAYGSNNAMNILSGFSTIIAYKVSDYASREYLVKLFGRARKKTVYYSAISSRGIIESLDLSNVVEDWDILSLEVGECIIRLASSRQKHRICEPFYIKLNEYR